MDFSDVALPELLFASANASVHFALACLEPVPANHPNHTICIPCPGGNA